MTQVKPRPRKDREKNAVQSTPSMAAVLLTVALVVGMIYVAKPVLVPLALAVLITFIFTPLVTLVQRTGLSRVPAVATVVLCGLLVSSGIGWGVYTQVHGLYGDLPYIQARLEQKLATVQGGGHGRIGKLLGQVTDAAETKVESVGSTTQPATVVVMPAGKSSVGQTLEMIGVILEPVGTAGLVLILVIFMLIRREDLRNRVIGLLGHGRLTGTTRVTVEAAQRLSKYLLAQLSVNIAFGSVFGIALGIIGVPYAFLWAFLTAMLRFVPYVGTWAAASAPLLLSIALSNGYGHPLAVFIVFFALDAITGNAIEPVLFGHSTGVSPVALLIAAAFWTWIWGTVGLVLSTPMTVCLVVLGQHVPRLRWLSLLLGDRPALDPDVSFYQRLLAGDRREAAAVVDEQVKRIGIERAFDNVVIPAIRRTRRDRVDAGLTAEDERLIFEATEKVIAELPADPKAADPKSDDLRPHGAGVVLAVASHHRSEEIVVSMFSRLLAGSGLTVVGAGNRMLPSEIEAVVERQQPAVIFIAVMPPGGLIQARYLCRRLGKRFADLKIVIGFFGSTRNFDRLLRRLRAAGASYANTSLSQSKGQILALMTASEPATSAAAEPASV
jgi:predicted PurR-regulated permease PerM